MKDEIKSLIKQLKTDQVRAALSSLRQVLKQEGAAKIFYEEIGQVDSLYPLLEAEDPKVRKNIALLLGQIEEEGALMPLWQAYQQEQQHFVKSSYLKALQSLDCESILEPLRGQLKTLYEQKVLENEEKHIKEEIHELQKLLSLYDQFAGHRFTGWQKPSRLLLTMPYGHGQLLAQHYPDIKSKVISLGVLMNGGKIGQLLEDSLYGELLLMLISPKKISFQAKDAAEGLLQSDLRKILEEYHDNGQEAFRFRIQVIGKVEEKEKVRFIKDLSMEMEKAFQGYLQNDPSDYEIELRFYKTSSGSLQPFLKLFTIEENRFSYRKKVLSTSMRPELAAVALELARPYLTDGAHVLDPFCGSAVMLIERYKLGRVGASFGIDTFGEAIEAAKVNAQAANHQIHFIHRDYFDATFKEKFDELITEFPLPRLDDQTEDLYRNFFDASSRLLKRGASLVLLTTQGNQIKKQIRLHPDFSLVLEEPLRKRDGLSLFVLKYN